MENYKQIKSDLDQLRSIVEKSELWVYKRQGSEEVMDAGDGMCAEPEHKLVPYFENSVSVSIFFFFLLFISLVCLLQGDAGGVDRTKKPESTSSYNYRVVKEVRALGAFLHTLDSPHTHLLLHQILLRLSKLCVQEGLSGRKSRKQQQRLLRNMGAHAVVLELLQIPYEKVSSALTAEKSFPPWFC